LPSARLVPIVHETAPETFLDFQFFVLA